MTTTTITDTKQAFLTKIQALYFIENELTKALPKMEAAATDPTLKEGFRSHLEETKEQVERLEQVFSLLDAEPEELPSDGITGIVADGEWVMDADAPEETKDAMLASAARYVEHYEMAGYMSAIDEARALGLDDAEELLERSLHEEEVADQKLATAMNSKL